MSLNGRAHFCKIIPKLIRMAVKTLKPLGGGCCVAVRSTASKPTRGLRIAAPIIPQFATTTSVFGVFVVVPHLKGRCPLGRPSSGSETGQSYTTIKI